MTFSEHEIAAFLYIVKLHSAQCNGQRKLFTGEDGELHDIVSSNTIHTIMFTFGLIPLGKVWNSLSPNCGLNSTTIILLFGRSPGDVMALAGLWPQSKQVWTSAVLLCSLLN